MKKFKFFVVLLLFTQSVGAFSQDGKDTLKNEVLFSTSFGHNGMYYSRRISDKLWLRTGVGLFYDYDYTWPNAPSVSYPNSKEEEGIYLVLGVISNNEIKKSVEFSYGSELYYEYSESLYRYYDPMVSVENQKQKYIVRKYGIRFISAFYYKISNNFMLGTRFKPSFYYYFSENYYRISVETRFVDYFVVKFRF